MDIFTARTRYWLCLLVFPLASQAAPPLRIGFSDSDNPPIVVMSDTLPLELKDGLIKELGDQLAAELGTVPDFVMLSRKRIESGLEGGKVDIVCNANPSWFGNADRLGWTRDIYPQTERLVSLKSVPDITSFEQLASGPGVRRISTIHGYSYPTLDTLWVHNKLVRQEEMRHDLMLKSVEKNLADMAVMSELGYVWWARQNPARAAQLKMHPLVTSAVLTMCAVSPASPYTVARLNIALDRLARTGKLKTLLKRYQWLPD